jgi:hypothetical protein
VGLSGRADVESRRLRDPGQARVAGLADLNRPVVDELGGDETGSRRDDHEADRPLWRDDRAGPGGQARRRGAGPAQLSVAKGEAAEEAGACWSQARAGPRGGSPPCPPGPAQQRMEPLQASVGGPVDPSRPLHGRLGELRGDRAVALAYRCYHRPSLRQFLRSTLRRARLGPFFAPIPLSAGSLPIHSFPDLER